MLLKLMEKRTGGAAARVPVMGLTEWFCYYMNCDVPTPEPDPAIIDECIDAHLAVGIDHIVWSCGRSVVEYCSDLPNTTRMCERRQTAANGESRSFIAAVMKEFCPLRRAIEYCRRKAVPILGRLGMNRHYGPPGYEWVTSRFSSENPHFRERTKIGNEWANRLCYAIEEVRQERIDILLEIQRTGVDALVLDFCRQMPMLMYHDALVQPYIKERGFDPRQIDSPNPDDYRDWWQYRADILTGFMRKLRKEVRRQEQELGRECPVIARVPDDVAWLMIAYGLDVERWCAEDLVDGTMLSPFPRCRESLERHPEYHIALAHKYDKVCIGGVGAKHLIHKDGRFGNTGFFHRKPVYQLADRQYKAGADAMSLYQTEMLARMPYLKDTLKEIGDKARVARRARELPDPDMPADYPIGMDWHTRLTNGESLRTGAGDYAL